MIPFGEQAKRDLARWSSGAAVRSQRLVGPGDYTEVPHTFDGVQTIVQIGGWTVTPFWTQP